MAPYESEDESNRHLLSKERDDAEANEYRPRVRHWANIPPHVKTKFLIPVLLLYCVAVFVLFKLVYRFPQRQTCGFEYSDALFGQIPQRKLVYHGDEALLHTLPDSPAWDDLFPNAWVYVQDPASVGLEGGLKLSKHSADPASWSDTTEAYAVSVMHQLHCLGSIKMAFRDYEARGIITTPMAHVNHCTDYVRSAIMCHGDLTLEHAEQNITSPRAPGWGTAHKCRDWDVLASAIRERGLDFGPNGLERKGHQHESYFNSLMKGHEGEK